jgi:hypothetical protein
MATGIYISADAMFRSVKSNQIYSGSIEKDIDSRPEMTVDTAGVGYKSHTFSLKFLEAAIPKHFDTWLHNRTCSIKFGRYKSGHDSKYDEQSFHIFIY